MNLHERLTKIAYTGAEGLYSAVTPTTYTRYVLKAIIDVMGNENYKPEELHCTVMYSPKDAPPVNKFEVNSSLIYTATAKDFKVFGHDDKVLVLTLESDMLQSAHNYLTKAGAKHTFTPYEPHVTLFKMNGRSISDIVNLDSVQRMIHDRELRFTKQFIGNISL